MQGRDRNSRRSVTTEGFEHDGLNRAVDLFDLLRHQKSVILVTDDLCEISTHQAIEAQ